MAKAKSPWRNRIVGYSEEEPDQLLANPSNWRIHPAAQQNALSGVLKEVGLVQNVVANRTTGHLVDGHLRVMLAMRENQPVVPVTWVELSEEEEHLILAALDPLAAMATADAGALDALLSSVQSGDAAVTAMLAELAEGAGLYQPQDDPQDAEPQVDRAEELRVKWGVESGQLWRLPSRTPGQEHRLICGDCTDGGVVERVMGGERAGAVVTDPPWNVGWQYDTYKDELSPEEYRVFSDNWRVAAEATGASLFFVAMSMKNYKHFHLWFPMAERVFAECQNFTQHTPEFMQYSFNPILIWGNSKKPGQAGLRDYYLAETSITKMTADKVLAKINTATRWLPTIQYLIGFVAEGDIVYEPFLGSGTTLIAAENLSRQCRAVELSPGYVAVALERYATAFGIEPELIT